MKRKQFSEEQVIGILKEAEAGAVVTNLCRRQGMSSATYYAWKAKFGGLEVPQATAPKPPFRFPPESPKADDQRHLPADRDSIRKSSTELSYFPPLGGWKWPCDEPES